MTSSESSLARTRGALHQVAEHVLAAAEYAATNEIALQPAPGGFETRHPLPGNRRLAVVDGLLTISDDGRTRSTELTTLREAAAFVGATAGMPASVYTPTTPLALDEPLIIEMRSAQRIAEWFALGDAALRAFVETIGVAIDEPTLWPEHFDLAITVGDVNYGASPGDAYVAEPYLYVGPFAGPPQQDAFWNQPFGAVRQAQQVETIEDAVEFFVEGRHRVSLG